MDFPLFERGKHFNLQLLDTSIDTNDHIRQLPWNVMCTIFSYFSVPELIRLISPVCKEWYQLSHNFSLWKRLKISSHRNDDYSKTILQCCYNLRALYISELHHPGGSSFLSFVLNIAPNLTLLAVRLPGSFDDDLSGEICSRVRYLKIWVDIYSTKSMETMFTSWNLVVIHLTVPLIIPLLDVIADTQYTLKRLTITTSGYEVLPDTVLQKLARNTGVYLESVRFLGGCFIDSSRFIEILADFDMLIGIQLNLPDCIPPNMVKALGRFSKITIFELHGSTDPQHLGWLNNWKPMFNIADGCRLSTLVSVRFRGCDIDDLAFKMFCMVCGQTLVGLYINYCSKLTHVSFQSILSYCVALTKLDIHITLISDDSLRQLCGETALERCGNVEVRPYSVPNLKLFYICAESNMVPNEIVNLSTKRPNMVINYDDIDIIGGVKSINDLRHWELGTEHELDPMTKECYQAFC